MENYSAIKKNEIMPSGATWMDLEIIILSEVSRTKTNIIRYHLHEESKKKKKKKKKQMNLVQSKNRPTDIGNKLMVTKGERSSEG